MVRGSLAAFAVGIAALWLVTTPAAAEDRPDFATWLSGVKSDAVARGVSQATVEQALADVRPIDRVIELDRRQTEFTLTFDEYLSRVVTPERVSDGRDHLHQRRSILAAVAQRYGVPAPMIVAMWGIESNYGRSTGGFSVVPALATLAYDGRRSQYFRDELINALAIVDRGVPASSLHGSWAGAMGQCQFMPSTYLKYAKGWFNAGRPDIWTFEPDVFASTANYLAQIGWNGKQHWGRAVVLPKKEVDPSLFSLDVKKSLKEWRRLGIRLVGGKTLPARSDIRASLIRAETGKGDDTGHGPPYLVYDNFRVIMKWNRSVFFALAAGTLADKLGSR
jgi:membrane-bound lytic murein transglycosylase B